MTRNVSPTAPGQRPAEAHLSEAAYDADRLRRRPLDAEPPGMSRRRLLATAAALSTATAGPAAVAPNPARATGRAPATPAPAPTPAPHPASGIVKPLPEELFTVRGTNAETNWPALRGAGYLTPADRFFVRNHTTTPVLDAARWRLRLWGSGLRGAPGQDRAVEVDLRTLRSLPSETRAVFVECAGNGRSYYGSQQGEGASGTAWTLGAVGVARWRGVRLGEVLRRAGLTRRAVEVMPRGLDDEYVDKGVNLGRVRRPLPIAKALDDVLLAYEMNGEPLPYDHGYPVRVLVPSWVGISSVKWVGDIEVSAEPLFSPWNTGTYRMFGPGYPDEGSAPLTCQAVKSAFALAPDAHFRAGHRYVLHGRSWSGAGGVRQVEVSTDGGHHWLPAHRHDPPREAGWTRWSVPWQPHTRGATELLARATDMAGRRQPDRTAFNTQGYLFDAVVRHPVTVG